jgi:hypothetical protein
MASENLEKLQAAGVDVSALPEAQQEVLSSLTADEINTMVSIKSKLEASSEVETFAMKDNNTVGVSFF